MKNKYHLSKLSNAKLYIKYRFQQHRRYQQDKKGNSDYNSNLGYMHHSVEYIQTHKYSTNLLNMFCREICILMRILYLH